MAADIDALDDDVFVYSMDQGAARRRFHCSVGILVLLGVAIVAATWTLHPASEPTVRDTAWLMRDRGAVHSLAVLGDRG